MKYSQIHVGIQQLQITQGEQLVGPLMLRYDRREGQVQSTGSREELQRPEPKHDEHEITEIKSSLIVRMASPETDKVPHVLQMPPFT